MKAAEALVFHLLGMRLRALDFTHQPVHQTFWKSVSVGAWVVHVSVIKHESDLDLTMDVAVRVDAVENCINRWNTGLTAADKRRTVTVGAELGNIVDGRNRRWTIAAPSACTDVAEGMVEEFEKFGVPYLTRMSNLEAMLDSIASIDRSSWLHSPIHGVRGKKAVALALVLGKRDLALELVERFTAVLEAQRDFGLESFTTFASRAIADGCN